MSSGLEHEELRRQQRLEELKSRAVNRQDEGPDRTAAPNGKTAVEFEQFTDELSAQGRGARGKFLLIAPGPNSEHDGVYLDLLCLDDGGREFHGFCSLKPTDHAIIHRAHLSAVLWEQGLHYAWEAQDHLNAAARQD